MTRRRSTRANGYGGIFAVGRLLPLLRAATISSDPEADWIAYCDQLGETPPDSGERRLYPIIAHRLGSSARSVKQARLLSAECRQSKVSLMKEAALCQQVQSLLAPLETAPIYLKGSALKCSVYPEPWMRRSSDLDLFIPRERARDALELLASGGWKLPPQRQAAVGLDHQLDVQPGITMEREQGVELDLHWVPRVVFHACPDLTASFQAAAQSTDFEGTRIRIPSATWMLFETFDHGLRYNPVIPIRWMLDAWLLMEAGKNDPDKAIDFRELFAITARLKATARVQAGLAGMAAAGLPLPDIAQEWLATARASQLERFEQWGRLRPQPPVIWSMLLYGPDFMLRYPGSPMRKLFRLPYHVWVERCGYSSVSQVFSRLTRILSERA